MGSEMTTPVKNYDALVEKRNVIEHQDFDKIVQEVYGLPYDVQRGEYSQNSYIEVNGVNGKGSDQVGYWTGLKIGQYGIRNNYDTAKYVDFDFDAEQEILEYWANHSNKNASGYGDDRPFDGRYLDENGEYALWQPPEYWVFDNLCARGILKPGDYLIVIDW